MLETITNGAKTEEERILSTPRSMMPGSWAVCDSPRVFDEPMQDAKQDKNLSIEIPKLEGPNDGKAEERDAPEDAVRDGTAPSTTRQGTPAAATTTAEPEMQEPPRDSRFECDYDKNPTDLFLQLQRKEWSIAEKRAEEFVVEARTWVSRKEKEGGKLRWRLLPLHAAIIFKAPEAVVESLLASYPKGAQSKDDQGMLPLHLAFRHGSSEGTVNLLLVAFPQSVDIKDRKGRVPLVLAQASASPNRDAFVRALERGPTYYANAAAATERASVTAEQRAIFDAKLIEVEKKHQQDANILKEERRGLNETVEILQKELAKQKGATQVLVDHVNTLEGQLKSKGETERFLAVKAATLDTNLREITEESEADIRTLAAEVHHFTGKLQERTEELHERNAELQLRTVELEERSAEVEDLKRKNEELQKEHIAEVESFKKEHCMEVDNFKRVVENFKNEHTAVVEYFKKEHTAEVKEHTSQLEKTIEEMKHEYLELQERKQKEAQYFQERIEALQSNYSELKAIEQNESKEFQRDALMLKKAESMKAGQIAKLEKRIHELQLDYLDLQERKQKEAQHFQERIEALQSNHSEQNESKEFQREALMLKKSESMKSELIEKLEKRMEKLQLDYLELQERKQQEAQHIQEKLEIAQNESQDFQKGTMVLKNQNEEVQQEHQTLIRQKVELRKENLEFQLVQGELKKENETLKIEIEELEKETSEAKAVNEEQKEINAKLLERSEQFSQLVNNGKLNIDEFRYVKDKAQKQEKELKSLKIDWASAQARAAVLEAQLKSKIENEHELASQVSHLAGKLAASAADNTTACNMYSQRVQVLEDEREKLRATVNDLGKKLLKVSQFMNKMTEKTQENTKKSSEEARQKQAKLLEEASNQEQLIRTALAERKHMAEVLKQQEEEMEKSARQHQEILEKLALLKKENIEEAKDDDDTVPFSNSLTEEMQDMMNTVLKGMPSADDSDFADGVVGSIAASSSIGSDEHRLLVMSQEKEGGRLVPKGSIMERSLYSSSGSSDTEEDPQKCLEEALRALELTRTKSVSEQQLQMNSSALSGEASDASSLNYNPSDEQSAANRGVRQVG